MAIGIDQPENWELTFRGDFQATIINRDEYGYEYKPLPDLTLNVGSSLLMAGTFSKTAPKRWYSGAYISTLIDIYPGGDFTKNLVQTKERRQTIPLGQMKLMQFENYGIFPRALIQFPYWIEEVSLEIWYYIGEL